MPPPDRWDKYQALGAQIPETQFICFKVPLKEEICRNLPENQSFSPEQVIQKIEESGKRLGLVVDLTFTRKYYNSQYFVKRDIRYEKIFTKGHEVPDDDVVQRFQDIVDDFVSNNSDEDVIIGVHCTHGVNRTGYLVCRYMIERLNMDPDRAISLFGDARGHPIERENYLADLKMRPFSGNPEEQPRRTQTSDHQQDHRHSGDSLLANKSQKPAEDGHPHRGRKRKRGGGKGQGNKRQSSHMSGQGEASAANDRGGKSGRGQQKQQQQHHGEYSSPLERCSEVAVPSGWSGAISSGYGPSGGGNGFGRGGNGFGRGGNGFGRGGNGFGRGGNGFGRGGNDFGRGGNGFRDGGNGPYGGGNGPYGDGSGFGNGPYGAGNCFGNGPYGGGNGFSGAGNGPYGAGNGPYGGRNEFSGGGNGFSGGGNGFSGGGKIFGMGGISFGRGGSGFGGGGNGPCGSGNSSSGSGWGGAPQEGDYSGAGSGGGGEEGRYSGGQQQPRRHLHSQNLRYPCKGTSDEPQSCSTNVSDTSYRDRTEDDPTQRDVQVDFGRHSQEERDRYCRQRKAEEDASRGGGGGFGRHQRQGHAAGIGSEDWQQPGGSQPPGDPGTAGNGGGGGGGGGPLMEGQGWWRGWNGGSGGWNGGGWGGGSWYS